MASIAKEQDKKMQKNENIRSRSILQRERESENDCQRRRRRLLVRMRQSALHAVSHSRDKFKFSRHEEDPTHNTTLHTKQRFIVRLAHSLLLHLV